MNPAGYISERFSDQIALHLVKNHLPTPPSGTPLLLGISGRSGEGKTYHVNHVLADIGAYVVHISGGELEHADAGRPAELLRESYQRASAAVESEEAYCSALVLNDIETGIGDWGELVQYTVNRQTVFGELMHMCDYPHDVGSVKVRRVPIIMTGNDFTKLYGPLIRPGRMVSFHWTPSVDEKTAIVQQMFSGLDLQEAATLVAKFSTQPVAFFAHLRAAIQDQSILDEIRLYEIQSVFAALRTGRSPLSQVMADLNTIVALADELDEASRHVDYSMGSKNG